MADLHALHTNGSSTLPSFGPCLPHLVVEAPLASDAIAFYSRAFHAQELSRSLHPKRKAEHEQPLVLHAHLKFGAAEIMLCDESEHTGPNVKSPASLKGTSAILHITTDDADAAFARAVEAGAKPLEEVADQPWGMRYGKVEDPFGFVWSFGAPLKHVQAEEEAPVADGE